MFRSMDTDHDDAWLMVLLNHVCGSKTQLSSMVLADAPVWTEDVIAYSEFLAAAMQASRQPECAYGLRESKLHQASCKSLCFVLCRSCSRFEFEQTFDLQLT